MPAHRLPDSEKRARGTYDPRYAESALVHGRTSIVSPLPPPSDLDAAAKKQWRVHMTAVARAGTFAPENLLAFLALVEAATARAKAYRAAMDEGPSVSDGDGGMKPGPAWRSYCVADQRYQAWCQQFGLTPYSAKALPKLPPADRGLTLIRGTGG